MSRSIVAAVRIVAGPVILFVLAFLALGPVTAAQTPDFDARVSAWEHTLKKAEKALSSDFTRTAPAQIKESLQKVTEQARSAVAAGKVRLSTVRQQLDSLGPAPKKGEPPEAPQIARLRKSIQESAARAEARITQAKLAATRAEDALKSIAVWEQAKVRARLLHRRPVPLDAGVWAAALRDVVDVAAKVTAVAGEWARSRAREQGNLLGLSIAFAMPVLGLVAGWPARRWALARFGRDAAETEPGYARRIVAAFVDGVANALAPVAVIAVVVGAMVWQGLLDGLFRDVVFAASVAGAAFLVVFGVARAALSPYLVAWRIVPVEPDYAGRLLAAIRAVAGVFSVAGALLVIAHSAGRLSGALESAFFTVQTSVAALAIVWALTPRYWAGSIEQSQKADVGQSRGAEVPDESPQDADHPRRRQGWRHMANLLRAAVLLTPVLALFGYGRLAFFLQSRLVATGVLVGFGLLLRLSLHEMLARVFARRHRGAGVADESGVAGHVGQYWVGLILDAAVFLPLGYLLLLVYGVPGTTLSLWVSRLLSGFTVGDITVSFTGVLYGALIFAVGIVATNLIRRWLANRVLPNTRLDSGARNSIASGTGYVGVALSVLFAVGALGIDFSNLALVAGALSLGIGFGLQNVVQNFAAGLLVLIERPVKVGDWIVVGSTEGTVKHISVRSTEIETFDRSSVIVPNSDLVSTAVTNWTHKNRIARIIVPVGVAYDSDARQVQRVLLECAAAQERVMSYPEPMALFVGFGDSALNFELRCYVTDTAYYLTTTSDLHFAIEEAFRREGIRIPFPQREITMRQA